MAKSRNGNAVVEWYGFDDLIKKIEKAQGSVTEAVVSAIKKSAEPVKKDMQDYVNKHSPEGSDASKWATGSTRDSWKERLSLKKDSVTYSIGYSIRDGGLASIFLNYGSPTTYPSFFIEKAVENNVDKVATIQEETLKEILKGLM